MPKDAPLAVEVPAPEKDNPGWVKVGVIAAVGFIVGIAWPRLVGLRLGPAAPGTSAALASASASAHGAGGRAPEAPPASVVAKGSAPVPPAALSAPAVAPSVATPASSPPNITVRKGSVLSCKTSEGDAKKGKECGPVPGIDQLVQPRIRKIATCSGVEGQTGKLSLIINADFGSGRISYDVGKSSTLPNIDAVTACLKTSFHGTSTTATPHEHSRYTVAYTAIFAPLAGTTDEDRSFAKKADKTERAEKAKEAPPSEEKTDKTERADLASGEAAVAWEVALVRDAPKTGGLLSRLPRGTKVKVGAAKDGWFQIKFGEGYAHEGWVYRGAIGR